MTLHARIARRFDRAAAHYDADSAPQRHAAEQLTQRIIAAGLPPAPRVLEIGCGTGHLTQSLLHRLPSVDFCASDIAPAMVAACRQRLPGIRYLVMDGQQPAVCGSFDLICANLAAQWFGDLPAALRRWTALLAPGGMLAFSMLGNDTFHEWRAAHQTLGLRAGTPAFPRTHDVTAMFPPGKLSLTEEHYIDHPSSALGFLHQLRAIGADTAASTHQPLGAGQLRKVLRQLGDAPTASYHLIYLAYRPEIYAHAQTRE
jgi:malonyl-ACP O-methyltransferase BioC